MRFYLHWKQKKLPIIKVGSTASFQWLTLAKATLKPSGVLLEQNGKSLMINVKIPRSKVRPEIVIEDVSKSKTVQDSDNLGLSRIVIRVKTPPKSTSGLVVTAIPSSK
jgi:hypothetical protein